MTDGCAPFGGTTVFYARSVKQEIEGRSGRTAYGEHGKKGDVRVYWRFVLRRFIHVALTYIVIVFLYSALFNMVMDQTQMSQIREQVQGEVMARAGRLSPVALTAFRRTRTQALIHQYHLDEPTLLRIFWRAVRTLRFDFGRSTNIKSMAGEEKVSIIVAEKIPPTILLFTVATFVDILIGVALGIKQAQKPGGLLDRATSLATMVVFGLPTWWLAMIFIMFFVYRVAIFASGGMHSVPPPAGIGYYLDLLYHLALPVLTYAAVGFWGRAYLTRNIVLGTLQEDFIMSARARGLPERIVLFGHTLRTASPPIITMATLSLLFSFGGALIFEGIFSWPGMGNLYWVAVQQNDIPVLMGNLAVTTLIYLGGILVLDMIYGFLDPRIKVGGRA